MLLLGNTCRFVPVFWKECPLYPLSTKCEPDLSNGEMCVANGTLPDGNTDFNINNCNIGSHGVYDIFKCVKSNCIEIFYLIFIFSYLLQLAS